MIPAIHLAVGPLLLLTQPALVPAKTGLERSMRAVEAPFVVEAALWLFLPGMGSKMLAGFCLMAAGLIFRGIGRLTYGPSTAEGDSASTYAQRHGLRRRSFHRAVCGVRWLGRCLFTVGFVLFWLGPIIDMGWYSPPTVWTGGAA